MEVIEMLVQARFSRGQETTGDSFEKARIGRFSDGQEVLHRRSGDGGCPAGCSCS